MSFPAQAPQSRIRPPTANEIWNGADETLRKIDQSFLVTQHQPRDFPQFTMNELTLGSLLGKGGFSDVSEVVNIQIPESDAVASLPVAPPKDDDDHANDPILIPREPLEDDHENVGCFLNLHCGHNNAFSREERQKLERLLCLKTSHHAG